LRRSEQAKGATTLDLGDIGFASAGETTFGGAKKVGALPPSPTALIPPG
jgi:hypothetical protein